MPRRRWALAKPRSRKGAGWPRDGGWPGLGVRSDPGAALRWQLVSRRDADAQRGGGRRDGRWPGLGSSPTRSLPYLDAVLGGARVLGLGRRDGGSPGLGSSWRLSLPNRGVGLRWQLISRKDAKTQRGWVAAGWRVAGARRALRSRCGASVAIGLSQRRRRAERWGAAGWKVAGARLVAHSISAVSRCRARRGSSSGAGAAGWRFAGARLVVASISAESRCGASVATNFTQSRQGAGWPRDGGWPSRGSLRPRTSSARACRPLHLCASASPREPNCSRSGWVDREPSGGRQPSRCQLTPLRLCGLARAQLPPKPVAVSPEIPRSGFDDLNRIVPERSGAAVSRAAAGGHPAASPPLGGLAAWREPSCRPKPRGHRRSQVGSAEAEEDAVHRGDRFGDRAPLDAEAGGLEAVGAVYVGGELGAEGVA